MASIQISFTCQEATCSHTLDLGLEPFSGVDGLPAGKHRLADDQQIHWKKKNRSHKQAA